MTQPVIIDTPLNTHTKHPLNIHVTQPVIIDTPLKHSHKTSFKYT